MTSPSGRALTITYAAHRLSPDDLVEPDSEQAASPASARDEHNRPLRLLLGLVKAALPTEPV